MYEQNRDLIDGYTKSLWKAFGGVAGSIFAIALLVATQILPITLLIAGVYGALVPFLLAGLNPSTFIDQDPFLTHKFARPSRCDTSPYPSDL
jgi:hypothetical protein